MNMSFKEDRNPSLLDFIPPSSACDSHALGANNNENIQTTIQNQNEINI